MIAFPPGMGGPQAPPSLADLLQTLSAGLVQAGRILGQHQRSLELLEARLLVLEQRLQALEHQTDGGAADSEAQRDRRG